MPITLHTSRDLELFGALERCPLTAAQILKVSATFGSPFTSERRVRERLQQLVAAGRLRRHVYETAAAGILNYYTLSPLGFQLLHGHKAPLPRSGLFQAVGPARQKHTRCLADFIVHTAVCAAAAGIAFTNFHRENSLRLEVDGDCLYPDGAFQLIPADGREFSFFHEHDNASERVRSLASPDSWERKLRLYDALQDRSPKRFRVLVTTTGGEDRLAHILAAAKAVQRNRYRSLLYGIGLARYVDEDQALTSNCFLDHRGREVALVTALAMPATAKAATTELIGAGVY